MHPRVLHDMTRDFRSEFRDAIRGRSRNTLKLGELAHELSLEPDSDYNQLRQLLITEDGLDAPDESTISRYRTVHRYWRIQAGIPSEELEARGVSKLYLLATHIEEHGGDPREWLEATKGLSKRELQATLKGEQPEPEGAKWNVPKEVTQAFAEEAQRFYPKVGHQSDNATPAMEYVTLLLREMSPDFHRQAWAQAHGEAEE
jgi:hypothetical protein